MVSRFQDQRTSSIVKRTHRKMSLVGPRPDDPEIASHWPASERDVIFSMRPGITSQATVLYRNEEKLLKYQGFKDDYLTKVLPDKLGLTICMKETVLSSVTWMC